MRITVFVFAVELRKVGTKCTSTDFWERTGASFKMACMWKGDDSIEKIRFLRIHIEILQLGLNMIKMALQWKSKWVSPSRELSNKRTAYVMHIPNTLSLILARNNRTRKIPIAFLFSNHHFNNGTSDAPIFHGGHYLVMRSNWEMHSAKPANHLNTAIPYFLTNVSTSSPVLIWLPSTPKMIRMLYISGTL